MTSNATNRDGIALRAYFIWDGEGRPHGRHDHHWFTAEAAEARSAVEVCTTEPAMVEAAPARAAVAPKAPVAKKSAAARKAAPAKVATPKAAAETVVAAAALAAPRAARTSAKGARRAH